MKIYETIKETIKAKKDMIILLVFIIGAIYVMNVDNLSSSTQSIGLAQYDIADERSAKMIGGGYYPSIYPDEPGYAPDEEKKIRKDANMNFDITEGKFNSAKDSIDRIIKTYDGFYFYQNENRNSYNNKDYRTFSISFKVPSDQFDSAISQLKNIGEIAHMSINSQDLTTQYIDIDKEIEAKTDMKKDLESLLENAKTTDEILKVKRQINDLAMQIESLQKQKTNINRQTDYSRITITLTEKNGVTDTFYEFTGIKQLAKNTIKSVNNVLVFISSIFGYAVFAIIVYSGYKLYKRKVR